MRRIHVFMVLAWFVVYGVWGSSYLALQVASGAAGPLQLSGLRGLIGGGVLWGVLRLTGRRLPGWSERAQWREPALVGVLVIGGAGALLAVGVRHLPSGLAAVLYALLPVFTCLLAGALDRTLRLRLLAGSLLGLIGTAVMFPLQSADPWAPGPWAILAAAALSAVAVLRTERGQMPPDLLVCACMQLLAGGGAALAFAWVCAEPAGIWTGAAVLAVLYLGVAVCAAGFCAHLWLTRRYGAAAVSSYAYVNPVVALLLGNLLLDEPLSPMLLPGLLLTVTGVWLVSRHPVR